VVKEFNTALKSRNRILKSVQPIDDDLLDSFTQKMAEYGTSVTAVRRKILEKISVFAKDILSEIELDKEMLTMAFRPGWEAHKENSKGSLLEQLRASLEQDKRRKQTTLGPQQDDFEVIHGTRPARRFASQGQQRSCALAMLLSVVQAVVSEGDEKPVILLDDVSSELDSVRRDRLFGQVCRMGSQVLVTTTDDALVSGLSGKLSRRFTVQEGLVREVRD
jgi:DNA replication and repair protein RecF